LAFNELELKRIKKTVGDFCRRHTRPELVHELRLGYEIAGQSVVVFEERPDWWDAAQRMRNPLAKFRYVRTSGSWNLYWHRADLKWHRYQPAAPTSDLAALVEIVERDECGAFFG